MRAAFLTTILLTFSTSVRAADPPLADYFKAETARIASKPLIGIDTAEAWKTRRPELQSKLKAMLGLEPEPPRGDLKVEVRGTIERPDFVIEKIVYQSIPGLYVTANLYRPKSIEKPLPAILYVCGHAKVEKDGVILGNKAHYQHHAAWFAANGYVCLIVDTLELGEIPGEHHGTYNKNRWWWMSRGYTPAGVEAWNAVRGIDYLVSRPDVDAKKIGVTGRSGGGATSWWVGAIDDRVAAVCPVAGITDLKNHVVDGVVEGHCDCMYFVNTERWDYTMLAALVAPKPLLVLNTDKDPIFPEDGVRRIYAQVEKVYGWYDAKDRVSLLVGKGGHVDSEELRHPSFAFFEKWLKGTPDARVVEPDRQVPIEELRVLKPNESFTDARNGTIDETFVPKAIVPPVPGMLKEFELLKAGWMKRVESEVFGGWPANGEELPLDVRETLDILRDGVRLRAYDFNSQEGVRLRMWRFSPENRDTTANELPVLVIDEDQWKRTWTWLADPAKQKQFPPPSHASLSTSPTNHYRTDWVLIAPRGVGLTAWDAAKDTHIRRRFALLGQSLAGMRVWDVRRAIAAIDTLSDQRQPGIVLTASGEEAATLALWAAVFEPKVSVAELSLVGSKPGTWGTLLGVDRILGPIQAASLIFPRRVRIETEQSRLTEWAWAKAVADRIEADSKARDLIHLEGFIAP